MKRLLFLLLFPMLLFAQTRNIVPRAAGQGGVGTLAKPWATSYFDTVNVLGPLFGSGPINIGSYSITSGLINGQEIDATANFTGSVTTAGTLSVNGTGTSYVMGNVGIGTTAPATNLEINTSVYNGSTPMIKFGSSAFAAANAGWGISGGGSYFGASLFSGSTRIFTVESNGGAGLGTTYSANPDFPANGLIVEGNVGIGTTGPNSTLHDAGSFATNTTSPTGSYIAAATDQAIFMSAASVTDTVFLSTAAGITGRIYTIKKVDSSVNIVLVDASGSELIDGANTYALATQYKYVVIQSNGTQWFIIGAN